MALADTASARPLRRGGQVPALGRIGALVATALAHLLVVAGLIAGLRQAVLVHEQEVFVQIPVRREPPRKWLPVPDAPLVINAFEAPVPTVNMEAPVVASGPVPPLMLPSPPSADPAASNAGPTWETALLSRVAGGKHYPDAAKGARGVVLLRFTMDREGRVLKAAIEKSSGVLVLDQEALAAIQRAQPLPVPPAEVPGTTLDLIVPVDFF